MPYKIAQNSHLANNQPQQQTFTVPNHGQFNQGPQVYAHQAYIPAQDQRVTYTQVLQHQPQHQSPQRIIINPQQQQFPSNVTYVQHSSSQYHPSPNFPVGQNVTSTQSVYTHGAIRQQENFGDRPKTGMELTLEKIDEQLQMSRRMFPS